MYKTCLVLLLGLILGSCAWLENDPLKLMQDQNKQKIDKKMHIPPGYHIKKDPEYQLPVTNNNNPIKTIEAPPKIPADTKKETGDE